MTLNTKITPKITPNITINSIIVISNNTIPVEFHYNSTSVLRRLIVFSYDKK